MSQKTNQFNLVTKRYTDGDIQNFINDSNSDVYTLSVTDKYGDSGITGLCIILFDNSKKSAEIDTFLMSCRIIGRNIEFAFMDFIIDKYLRDTDMQYRTMSREIELLESKEELSESEEEHLETMKAILEEKRDNIDLKRE